MKKLKLTSRKAPKIANTGPVSEHIEPVAVVRGAEVYIPDPTPKPHQTHASLRAVIDTELGVPLMFTSPVTVEQCKSLRDRLVQKIGGASVEVYYHSNTLYVRVAAGGAEVLLAVPLD